jgi:hypothetical protein
MPIQILLDLPKGMTGRLPFIAEAQELLKCADAYPLAPFLRRPVKSCSGISAILFQL